MEQTAKIKISMKDIPKCTPEMIEELKRRARIPNPNRQYPELPEWREELEREAANREATEDGPECPGIHQC